MQGDAREVKERVALTKDIWAAAISGCRLAVGRGVLLLHWSVFSRLPCHRFCGLHVKSMPRGKLAQLQHTRLLAWLTGDTPVAALLAVVVSL